LNSSYKKARDIKYSFAFRFPEMVEYWDFEKNNVNPYTIFPSSEYLAHWTCPLRHNVRMRVKHRLRYKGCVKCDRLIKKVTGSLYEIHPDIAKEWDYEKNYPITPKNIKPRTRKKFWWVCPAKGHSYPASPDNRVGNGSRCPYFYGNKKFIKLNF
jgi:hypothetical protein